jgi:hypothetical protein
MIKQRQPALQYKTKFITINATILYSPIIANILTNDTYHNHIIDINKFKYKVITLIGK